MEVNINEITSTVRAVDSDSLLEPKTLEKITRFVLTAVQQKEEHVRRVRAEQQVTGGVRAESEEGWR